MSPSRVKCPTCHREIDWSASPFRPFCSERCRLIDLGQWASEGYRLPTKDETPPDASGEA